MSIAAMPTTLDVRIAGDIAYYLGSRASELDQKCSADNPFLKRERERVASTHFGQVAIALDMPLFLFRKYPDGHEKRIQIPLRVQTPKGKGTIWQSWTDRMGVLLDSNLSQVTFFEGEELAHIEAIYERIYDLPIFAAWLAKQ